MYYNHGTVNLSPQSKSGNRRVSVEGFDLKLNIRIVVHALLCKVLPDNCTCVNTLNADFVLKRDIWINAMTIVHLKNICIIY